MNESTMKQNQVNNTLLMEKAMESAMERMKVLLSERDSRNMMEVDTVQNHSSSTQDDESNHQGSNQEDDEYNDVHSEDSQDRGYTSAYENAKNNDAGASESSAGEALV